MIIGVGNLVLDYYLYHGKVYVNGGHTISNILSNLSSMGIPTKIFGFYGDDILGKIAKSSIEKAGVDTSLLIKRKGNTKCFFIDPEKTSSICPFCGNKRRDFPIRKNVEQFLSEDDILLIKDYTVINRISNKVCLDFGYYQSLLYMDSNKIANFIFRKYYIVNLKLEVLNFLLKRLDISFIDFKKNMNIELLIITKGSMGATIVWKSREYHYTPEVLPSIETNGCGDMFLATFICEFIKRKRITKKVIDEIFDLAQKNVAIVLQNIGARNHLVPNMEIRKNQQCICQDFII